MVAKMKTSLKSLTSKVTAAEDRMSELEDEMHNKSIQQKEVEKEP